VDCMHLYARKGRTNCTESNSMLGNVKENDALRLGMRD
jgi:hypothetical protein